MQCNWEKAASTLIDPDQPWLGSTEVVTVYNPYICFVPATGNMYNLIRFLKGTETPNVTTFGLMAPQAFAPNVTDLVMRSGEPLKMVYLDTLQPNEQQVLHILGLTS
jgi:hypothetical protein